MDFSTENDTLSRISKALYGDALTLAVMDPKDISLLKKNARILKKDVFQQLTANIGRDKRLSSVPLCHRLSDGRVEVLSGNHRVQASVEAGIERILVMIIEEDLTRSQAVAIQLSHNALVGEDDPALLAELWAEIEDIAAKTYAGLSSDVVEKLDKIDLTSFTTPQVSTRTMTFAFVDSEAERLNAVLDDLDGLPAKEIWLADVRQFDRFPTCWKRRKDVRRGGTPPPCSSSWILPRKPSPTTSPNRRRRARHELHRGRGHIRPSGPRAVREGCTPALPDRRRRELHRPERAALGGLRRDDNGL
ncbi:MAG: ParB N-terminal domain-containing protein [Bilophila wadsworthia]